MTAERSAILTSFIKIYSKVKNYPIFCSFKGYTTF